MHELSITFGILDIAEEEITGLGVSQVLSIPEWTAVSALNHDQVIAGAPKGGSLSRI